MKKNLVGIFATVLLFSFCGLAGAEQKKNHPPPPDGLEAADAVELVMGAVESALIRDKLGVSRCGFGLKGVTIERYYSDKSVTYRNGVWIVQPLPLRETSEPALPLTIGLLCLAGFVVSSFRKKQRSRR